MRGKSHIIFIIAFVIISSIFAGCSKNNIVKQNLCYLGHDRNDKESPLKLIIVNKQTQEEKLYNIF